MVIIKYFVHGTTTDNVEDKSTGWLPGVLTDIGIQQSVDLAKTIKEEDFDIVFCSDLSRAVESTKLAFYNREIKIKQDKRLRECNYGDLNGKDHNLVDYYSHIDKRFPNGESMKDVEKRIRSFIEYLKKNYDGKKIAIVCHKAPQLAFEVICNRKSWQDALDTDWRNTKAWQPGWVYEVW